MEPSTGVPKKPHEPAQKRRVGRRHAREIFESLTLATQFRITAIAAVTVTLLVVQVVIALWDTWSAHHDVMAAARRATSAMAQRLEATGGGALDDLHEHPEFLAAALQLKSGSVLQHYVRDDPNPGSELALKTMLPPELMHPDGWQYRVLSALALAPIFVEHDVALGPGVDGTVSVVVDNTWIWDHAVHRLAQAPVALLLGCLIALLAANRLKRQVVEPLEALAQATRASGRDQSQPRGRSNELRELAANFEGLANQLVEYERDLVTLRHTSNQQIIDRTREIEGRLRHAELITRSKDDFLANMSHEIRTPMNGVLGMAELLAGTDLDKRQRRFVDSMRTAAETMMQIINDILDDSKIEAGKMELMREPFDVRDLAEQAGQLYAGRAETKKLEMICRIEPTVPSKVIGDVLRLRQVLGNLLSNAVKYTEKGEVEIRVGLDDMRDNQCRLHFSITDTGPGIPDGDQSGVFEAFTQLGNASRVGGTGLGLSIAKRLVALMGGERIELHSEMGRGSTFSFVLPFEVAEAAPMPDHDTDEFSGMRVLVIDDNATSYMLLQEMLDNWSVEVAVASTTKLLGDRMHDTAVRGKPFEVVLLDHNLPDATTEDLLRIIRLDPAIANTFVVLMSALDYNPAYEGTRVIAPDMCIAKPMGRQLLRGALQASRQPRQELTAPPPEATTERESGSVARDDLPALSLHVLVVDDNAINREVAVAMLTELRCNVDIAEDGRVAVGKAAVQRFDVILMDCQMPGMDGYAATEAIREDERRRALASTTIIALSANVLARDRERCLKVGMDAFLAKPFKSAQLVEALRPIAQARGRVPSSAQRAVAEKSNSVALPAFIDDVPKLLPSPPKSSPRKAVKFIKVAAVAPAVMTPKPTLAAALASTQPIAAAVPSSTAGAAAPDDDPLMTDTAVIRLLETVNVNPGPTESNLVPAASEVAGEPAPISRLPVLDGEQVQAIRGIGKPMLFERLCEMLFASSRDEFDRLDVALGRGDLPEVAAAAHSLKSPVNNLGGRRLADLLERCETAALEGRELAAVQRIATGLKPHYAALVAALEAETRRGTGTR